MFYLVDFLSVLLCEIFFKIFFTSARDLASYQKRTSLTPYKFFKDMRNLWACGLFMSMD